MLALRTLVRRRLRSVLTILGVAIAVFSLIVMGAVSERLRAQVVNSEKYYKTFAWVTDTRGFWAGSRMGADLREEIQTLPGVEYAASRVLVTPSASEFLSMNPWDVSMVVGLDLEPERCVLREMELIEGRYLEPGERGSVLLGFAAARKYAKRAGDPMEVRGRTMTVVGVLEMIGTDPDQAIFTSVDDAREMADFGAGEITLFAVKLRPDADETALKSAIEALRPDRLAVYTPTEMTKSIESALALFNSIVYGCGIVAVIVGTMGIANTMAMSVGERAREIATKKTIGATTGDVFREFLCEAVLMSAIGSVLGVGLGYAGAAILNHFIGSYGLPVFLVTPRLVAFSVLVALTVGALAGALPALQAARTDPVRILRST